MHTCMGCFKDKAEPKPKEERSWFVSFVKDAASTLLDWGCKNLLLDGVRWCSNLEDHSLSADRKLFVDMIPKECIFYCFSMVLKISIFLRLLISYQL